MYSSNMLQFHQFNLHLSDVFTIMTFYYTHVEYNSTVHQRDRRNTETRTHLAKCESVVFCIVSLPYWHCGSRRNWRPSARWRFDACNNWLLRNSVRCTVQLMNGGRVMTIETAAAAALNDPSYTSLRLIDLQPLNLTFILIIYRSFSGGISNLTLAVHRSSGRRFYRELSNCIDRHGQSSITVAVALVSSSASHVGTSART